MPKEQTFTITKSLFQDKFVLFDIPSLDENDHLDSKEAKEAIKNLLKLIKDEKFALIIFVKKRSSITQNDTANYEIVSKFNQQIPKLCVVTGCELDDNPFVWYKENEPEFAKASMLFKAGMSGCFAQESKFQKLYKSDIDQSALQLTNLIKKYALNQNLN